MEVHIIRLWISPSTLHLRVMVEFQNKRWVQFRDAHLSLSELDADSVSNLLGLAAEDGSGRHSAIQGGSAQPSLFDF